MHCNLAFTIYYGCDPEVKHLKDEIAKLKQAIAEGGNSEELTDELKERHRLVGHYAKCAPSRGRGRSCRSPMVDSDSVQLCLP